MSKDYEYDYSAHENQTIINIGLEDEVRTSYIDYAMSVIVGRALPDVRDGLKPVHRRILYAMYEDKLTYDKPFRKSATTVGDVLGRYHPHGDAAVYDTMVRMAQPFSLRYPLIEGHGNFGNIDGDGAAAYRYTEARMAKISNLMLQDIEKDVVDFTPNFDNRLKEPVCLPSRFPNLLVNGSIGIAVGMATNIPPHNMNEVIDAVDYLIDNPDCEIQDLIGYIKGPDFPTYGIIHGTAGIYEAYMTGRGRIKVRAKTHFEERGNKRSIIVTELPYQVNRSLLLENMANLVKSKRIEGISDIRNESGRAGMRIVIDLKREANANVVLNYLFKYTQLEDTFAINMLALVKGEPKVLNLKEMLGHYLDHQRDIIVRRTKFDLARAERSAHIYEGYKIAIDNIDRVIEIIRGSKTIGDAKENLMNEFTLTDIQAQAIVDMTLGRLSGMERLKIEETLASLYKLIEELKAILADDHKVTAIIKEDLEDIKKKFGDERRTEIEQVENEILMEDLIDRVRCVVTYTKAGYIKRLPADTYSAQRRGGKGITGMATKEEDFVIKVMISESHDYLMMFSNKGRVYIKKCYEIPESSRQSKGTNIVNVLSLESGEQITAIITLHEFTDDRYLVMMTKYGVIKRVNLMEYKTRRANGLFAITLDEGDELLYVMKTDGYEQIIAATHNGMAIRFDENDVRCVGRQARGVRAITLSEDDFVVGAAAITDDFEETGRKIITVTEGGFGKKCDIDDYTLQHRGGKGVICHRINDKTGKLCGIAVVEPEEEIMIITNSGIIIRMSADEIPVYGRAASGVIVMRISEESSIVGFTTVKKEETEGSDVSDGETGGDIVTAEDASDGDSENTEETNETESSGDTGEGE